MVEGQINVEVEILIIYIYTYFHTYIPIAFLNETGIDLFTLILH